MSHQHDELDDEKMPARGFMYPCGDWIPPAEIAESPFARRRYFFEHHPVQSLNHCTCPACGYPTLEYRGGFEYCSLCHWEDDGQDDPLADEFNGGPNGLRTLKVSRENFEITSSIFAFSEANEFHETTRFRLFSKTAQRELKTMRALFDKLMELNDENDIKAQWELIDAQWKRIP